MGKAPRPLLAFAAYVEAAAVAMRDLLAASAVQGSKARLPEVSECVERLNHASHVLLACWRKGYPPAKAVRTFWRFSEALLAEGIAPSAEGFALLSDNVPYPVFRPDPFPYRRTVH